MSPIAGLTAGPNGLKFVDTHEWPGGVLGKKKRIFLFSKFILSRKSSNFFFPRATLGPPAIFFYKLIN